VGLSTSIHDIRTLVLSFHPVIAIDTVEEERVEKLVDAVAEELCMPVFEWTMTRGLVQKPAAHGNRNTARPLDLMGHLRSLRVEGIFLLKDFARHLDDAAICREFKDAARAFSESCATMVITGASHRFPPDVDHAVVHYELSLPEERELREVVSTVVRSLRQRRGARVELTRPQLDDLVRALSGMTVNQARQAIARTVLEDGMLRASDIQHILDQKARALGEDGLLEYFPFEDNPFELGGFARLKQWLARARIGFSKEAAALNLKPPRGILMVGVQGCGKSLAAKCIAREWGLPLVKLDAGRLYDKYVGESEKNLRRAIEVAESMSPVVLWIDEIEKGFTPTGGEHDGGLSKRIFATFLTWMQEKKKEVFVVATANDVFSLPPEFLRKGRFDEIFFVDLPDLQERATIFRIHLSHRMQTPSDFDFDALVAQSEGFSGAEIEQAVIAGLYRSLHEKRPLDTGLLLKELRETVPLSVSRREDIDRLRAMAGERFVPVR
jgi:AAA+ superfamily predicted ATPase